MNSEVKTILSQIKNMLNNHPGLKAYFKKNRTKAPHRFWNLFRADLMRRAPGDILEYLRNPKSKLAEVAKGDSNLGEDLAQKFVDQNGQEIDDIKKRLWQEALIYACLEMDAAWKLKLQVQKKNLSDDDTMNLKARLNLWEVPR